MSDRGDENSNNSCPEVPAKASRHGFAAAYKLKILEETDRCSEPGSMVLAYGTIFAICLRFLP